MFRCERCGSSYSALHAAGIENCPRCLVRDRTESPLTFKAFELHGITAPSRELPMPTQARAGEEERQAV